MEPNPKFLKLLREILAATLAGEAPWREGFDEDTYRISKHYGMLEVHREQNRFPTGGMTYSAELIDQKGAVTESATTVDAPASTNGPGFPHVELLRSLFEAAAKSVRRSDAVLDQMLAEFTAKGRG